MKTTYALLGGISGALAMPHLAKRADYACNPAHSYPNGASCVSTNGALSLVTPAPSSTGYACNPAHSYPNGASCVSTNGALSLVTPAPASTTEYACNPAHSYPNGASCVSTNGALSLVTPAPSSTGYACNPAHSYPNGASCVSTNGALSLVTAAPSATTTTYACNPAHSYPNGQTCTAVNGALTLVTPSAAAPKATSSQVAPQLGTWTIENLTRYCSADGAGCDYNFEIKTSDGFGDKCTVSLLNDGPKANWANKPCTDGSVYHISWGYAESSNPPFAVMTVDQIQDKTRAFFGVPDVNGQFHGQQDSTYGSGHWEKLGPEPVNPVN